MATSMADLRERKQEGKDKPCTNNLAVYVSSVGFVRGCAVHEQWDASTQLRFLFVARHVQKRG